MSSFKGFPLAISRWILKIKFAGWSLLTSRRCEHAVMKEKGLCSLTYTFRMQPNAIILAVTAANTDIANSDAIRLACESSPIPSFPFLF